MIYGDSLCHEYAWANVHTRGIADGGVNFHVAWNGKLFPYLYFWLNDGDMADFPILLYS